MSKIEMFLIIGACLVPIIALLFVLPKYKKKEKTPPPTTPYVKEEPADKHTEQPKEVKPIQKQVEKTKIRPAFNTSDIDDDFKTYLELKKKRTPAPEAVDEGSFVRSPVGEYIPARLRANPSRIKKDKSIAEQINDLSPELKAMLLAGVLDKKDYN